MFLKSLQLKLLYIASQLYAEHMECSIPVGFRSGVDHFFFFVITLIGLSTAGVCVVFSIGAVIGVFTVAQNMYSLFFTFSLVNTTLNDMQYSVVFNGGKLL